MYMAYCDTSGSPGFADPEDYVVAAAVVDDRSRPYLDDKIDKIRSRHFPGRSPADAEIHAKDIINHTGAYKGMPDDRIRALLDDVFGFISDPDTPLVIMAALVRKGEMRPPGDNERLGYGFIIKRLAKYLSTDKGVHAMMVVDGETNRKNWRLHKKLAPLLEPGAGSRRIIASPLFTNSRWTNMTQVADCVAYCIRRRFRKGPGSSGWSGYYSAVEKKLLAGGGLKMFVKSEGGP